MDLLIDVNVALDICTQRQPHALASALAMEAAKARNARLWLYCGSTQTLEYNLYHHLKHENVEAGSTLPNKAVLKKTRQLLSDFANDKHWLAALAGEGPVFDARDPEDAQLLNALDRFPAGSIRLLTRDGDLLDGYPDKTISPLAYCEMEPPKPKLAFIDLAAQQQIIRPELERNIHRVLHHGQYILGPEVRELEQRLAAYTGAKHCITVASGTEALLISLMALGIKPGDEVITTPFTFVATGEMIVLLGATPVFVDIEPDTCNIDARLIEAKITERTKAIMPVSLYGQPADMDAINAIAARHGNIPVIEDAAQSFGATYQGRKSCHLSTIGCTSFFPSKPLGCYGDGGAIFTSDDRIAQACREIRVHGQSQRYVHTRIGVGGRMDTLQCAIVLAKLDRFDEEITQRQAVARKYHQLLAAEEDVRAKTPRRQEAADEQNPLSALASLRETFRVLPWPLEDRTSVFAQYTILADDREALQANLNQAGIPTAVHYPVPLNEQPAYAHLCCPDCTPVAQQIAKQVISLPMHPLLTPADQNRIVHALTPPATDPNG
ncbi:DegT/DnrJ/EryC1/StrS family protein [Thioalkalivibrio nitratireducens DSM 14787]|uniref:DegT/DnrJ/EryC1/StrS family protein n=1 Tax=Thioalkalivibrio nitratireducens (strain DSM 14787 / UNIQEM 213 / ALEN2) TaxID=1255043 RepID=L0DTQ2_THIND|nr:DegT/DnrJ/EryC1/StrS family aminotransferase [Thioalkalivibrio nitratireducens]AGA32388.1 DegT/DnrJ/EryC1/StrS family protein [Thioalkalivibrio nitratireducens DSM 14787]